MNIFVLLLGYYNLSEVESVQRQYSCSVPLRQGPQGPVGAGYQEIAIKDLINIQ